MKLLLLLYYKEKKILLLYNINKLSIRKHMN